MALTLQETIATLESSDWVQLRFITADLNKGTGGQVIELQKCRIARNRQAGSQSKDLPSGLPKTSRKDPGHSFHFTRNLELPNKQLRKVHPALITHINHQSVI